MVRAMKDSGVEWIGEIPESWKLSKLGRLTDCYDYKRIPIDKSMRESGKYPYWGAGKIMDYVNDFIFDEELILLGEDSAPFEDKSRDVSHFVNEKIWVNNHIHVLKGKKFMSNKFLNYYLNIVNYSGYITGSIMKKLTQENMNKILVSLPSLEEQQRIANFLDEKTAHLDSIIANTTESIEAYKQYKQALITETVTKGLNKDARMKPSGIEWIGEIPEGWEVISTKGVFNVVQGGTPTTNEPTYWEGGTIPWITPKDMNSLKDGEIYESKKHITELGLQKSSAQIIPKDSIVISSRAPVGKVIKNKVEVTTNQGCKSLVSKDDSVDSNYYYFLFSIASVALNVISTGTTFVELSGNSLSNFKIVYPNLYEQVKISTYLNEKTKHIDSLIANKEKLVKELEAYKKTMIYEYVTGKKEVL